MSSAAHLQKKKIVLPEDDLQERSYSWHSHDYREVLQSLGSSEEGLSIAEVEKRREENGLNEFSVHKPPSFLSKILKQLRGPLSLVLLAAFFVTVFLKEYIDAGVIALALIIALVVALWQEGKASGAFSLLAAAQTKKATVIRTGQRHEIFARELVVGDVVELQAGMQVPADMRVLHFKKLYTNEASLTGEWLPIEKHNNPMPIGTTLAEQENMLFKGTSVIEGYGVGIVVAIGDKTAVGEIAHDLKVIEDEKTPLQAEIEKLSYILLYVIGGVIIFIASSGIYLGQSVHDMLLLSIAVAVAAIPEGLPAAVTIVLAIGMESLLKRGGLVRNLLAAETLGATSYILTDKTGTLTEAKMTMAGIITAEGSNFNSSSWVEHQNLVDVLQTAYCATDTYIDEVAGKNILRGEPTERAVAKAMLALSVEPTFLDKRIDYLPFSSEQQFAAGLTEVFFEKRLCVNGAPELLLTKATAVLYNGEVVEMTEELFSHFYQNLNEQTKAGQRLLAVAYKRQSDNLIADEPEDILEDLIFMGILVLSDPVRPGIKEAVEKIISAGAKIILVTGDNPATALNIAKTVGIADAHETALIGSDIINLSDTELREVLQHAHVFARVLPRQKMRIASVLQQMGEIVAMTGDGVNDAPALQKANIGIALGSGTQVAKEAADLILTKDSFVTMYAAIEEGRRIGSNIRKIVAYLLSTSFTEVILIGVAVLTGAAAPLLPAQILWANIIEEGLMSVAFAFEKGEKGIMKRRPRDLHEEGIFSTEMWQFMGLVIFVLSSITLLLYFYLINIGLDIDEIRSAMFLAVAIDSLFLAFAFRSLTVPIFRIPLWENRFFLMSFIISGCLLFGALSIPFMRTVLSYEPLPGSIVLLILGASILGLLVVETAKWLFFENRD